VPPDPAVPPPDGTIAEHVRARPHPALARYVEPYVGYRCSGFAPGTHAGLPSRSLTCIVTMDEPLDLAAQPDPRRPPVRLDAMVGGLHAAPATVRHDGRQFGIQLALTPLGARALLGVRAGELAGVVEPLDVVLPRAAELVERVRAGCSWRERFDVLDDVLRGAVRERHAALTAELDAAWSLLDRHHGSVAVDEVARCVGWSRRHLAERFGREFGLTPKTAGRVMRFERSRQLLSRPDPPPLAVVAAACGYADQSHMTRDWREFAGEPPGAWRDGEELPFVQDTDEHPG
jgi:AraC-like DNA-binding protein